jgi:hypothetical protein
MYCRNRTIVTETVKFALKLTLFALPLREHRAPRFASLMLEDFPVCMYLYYL